MTTATAHRLYTDGEVRCLNHVDPAGLRPSQKKMRCVFLWMTYVNEFDKYHYFEDGFHPGHLIDFANAYGIPDLEKAKRIITVGFHRHQLTRKQCGDL